MLSLAWKDWERKASNFPPEVAFQLYSFHWLRYTMNMNNHGHSHGERTWQKLRSNIAVYFILFNSWIREARLL